MNMLGSRSSESGEEFPRKKGKKPNEGSRSITKKPNAIVRTQKKGKGKKKRPITAPDKFGLTV